MQTFTWFLATLLYYLLGGLVARGLFLLWLFWAERTPQPRRQGAHRRA